MAFTVSFTRGDHLCLLTDERGLVLGGTYRSLVEDKNYNLMAPCCGAGTTVKDEGLYCSSCSSLLPWPASTPRHGLVLEDDYLAHAWLELVLSPLDAAVEMASWRDALLRATDRASARLTQKHREEVAMRERLDERVALYVELEYEKHLDAAERASR